jgi:hypothetical protein
VIRVDRIPRPPSVWEDLCREDPHATLFLHPRWTAILAAAFPEFTPEFLVAEAKGEVAGLLPLMRKRRAGLEQFVSLPFGTHGGPVLHPHAPPETATALARAFHERVKGWRTLRFELSIYDPPSVLREAMATHLGPYLQEFSTQVVDLEVDFDTIWNHRYFKNTRNCVRMGERAGVTVAEEQGREPLEVLARFHAEQTKAWPGIPPFSLASLEKVVEGMGEDARLYVARREGNPLAACLVLEHEGRESHPWVSGASPEARPLRAFHLLIHTALHDAWRRGRRTWNFGGSGGNPKVEFFKESFAAVPVPVLRCFHMAPWARRLREVPEWD